ncbi:MAG TPA: Calx-beta domain-containing protein [Steroidobacteraceae bacterium]|nr:Calx-beta domain-containing protein [Steroidobacteraceae bacterium]
MVARIVAALLVVLLAGCGGGGGTQIAESPPALGAPGTLQLKATVLAVSESAGKIDIAVTRTGGSVGALSVTVTAEDGSATAGQDFAATTTTVQFADGDTADKIVSIALIDDAVPEGNETFKVSMTSAAGPSATPLTVTIVDDDPPGTLQLSSATYSVGEGAGSIGINVTRVGGSAGPASVTVSTQDGVAVAGQDYGATSVTVTFAAGDATPKLVTIPILDDAVAEPDEAFQVALANASGATLGAVTSATITIPANDQPPPPPANGQPGSLQLSASAYGVNESSGNLIVTITRVGGTNGVVGATLTITPGSAVAGSDYVGTSSTVSFGAGDASSRIVSIPIVNDSVAELAESFSVTLSAPSGGATLGAPTTAQVSISDNDPPNTPVVSLAATTKRLDLSWNAVPTALIYKVFLNPDGASGFTQVGANIAAPTTTASIDVSVHTFKWPGALVRVEACNDTACSGSPALSATNRMLSAIGYLKAASVDVNDQAGASVALSGDAATVVVGVPAEDSNATGIDGNAANNASANSGAAYVFARTADGWTQQAYVKAANAAAGDSFGRTVAISRDGSTIAIGAPARSSSAGAVYIFVRNGASWAQQAMLTAGNTQGGDRFGGALSLSSNGSLIAVGASGEDSDGTGAANNSAADAGAVYMFARTGLTWLQQAYIKSSNAQADDLFGGAVALNAAGTTLAVGAIGEASASTSINGNQADNTAGGAGAVYVFAGSGATWTQSAYIKAPNAEPIDHFGATVALSADGSTLAVGAPDEDGTVTGPQTFPIADPPDVPDPDPSVPVPPGLPNPLPTTFQGLCAVPIVDPDVVLRPTVGCESGAAYVFVRAAGVWSAQSYLKSTNNQYEDRFGTSVALDDSGNTIAVGAPSEDSGALGVEGNETLENAAVAGAAYVLVRAGTTWSQQSYVKAPNTDAGDAFGAAVALSSDAAALLVGATGEDSISDTNQNDDTAASAGAAYLY